MQHSEPQKIALGTAQFGFPYGATNKDGQVSLEKVSSILGLAVQQGVDTIDTAMGYGDSEEVLGTAGVKKFRVVTKLPAVPTGERFIAKWVEGQVRNSLKRLRLKKVYGLLLHRPIDLTGTDGPKILDSLQALQKEGMVEKIGLSVYHPWELEALVGKWHLTLVQAPFNLLDRRLVRSNWLARLSEMGIEVHVRSVLLQGLLLQPAQEMPAPFGGHPKLWEGWQLWLREKGMRPLDACLAYVKSFPEIYRIVVGVDNLSQWESILNSPCVEGEMVWPNIETEDENLILPYRWEKKKLTLIS